jgi:hypothetical protein
MRPLSPSDASTSARLEIVECGYSSSAWAKASTTRTLRHQEVARTNSSDSGPIRDEGLVVLGNDCEGRLEVGLVVEQVTGVLLAEGGPIIRIGDEEIDPFPGHGRPHEVASLLELRFGDRRTRRHGHGRYP